MARSRNIKPGFFTNDVLAEVHPLGRILFQGLWCHADREGRLEDRPRKLKAEVLPYDNCDIEALLAELEERRFIVRYQVDGCKYIQVVNFAKHQNPHIKEPKSSIPPPTSTEPAPDENQTSTGQAGLIPDSLNRIPDSLTQGNGASAPPQEYSEEFETAWNLYPPRAGSNPKKDAFKSWKARLKEGHTAEEMAAGVKRYRAYCEATKKFHTEYTMQASRFFGPSKPFTESWDIPRGTHETHQPTDNSAIGKVRRANQQAEQRGRTIEGQAEHVD